MATSAHDGGSVIVTGGASGIGLAVAGSLLAKGRRVMVADVVADNLDTARSAFAAYGDAVAFARTDVCDEVQVVDLIAAAARDLGPLRGVVNSAGIAREMNALDTSAELFRKILDVNVVGSFLVAREAAKAMQAAGTGGAIVNIASVSGIRGNVDRAAYGSSKGAVITLTQILAVEFASLGIRVNAVAPGPVETPLVKALHSPASRANWISRVPMRRYAQPEEMAGTVAFLLDEASSSYLTGQVIAVDGGFTAGGLLRD